MTEQRALTSSRWKSLLDTVATLAFIAAAGTLVWSTLSARPVVPAATEARRSGRPEPSLPADPISLVGAVRRGSETARVAVLMYSDFQCPYCKRFALDTLPKLDAQFVQTGKVLLAFRQFPLGNHPLAQKAAEASECADRQGKFWEFHDALFEAPESIDPAGLLTRARAIGLTEEPFRTCLSGQTRAQVIEDSASGRALEVSGTPTFFVGTIEKDRRVKVTKRFSGAPPLAAFEAVLAGLVEGTK